MIRSGLMAMSFCLLRSAQHSAHPPQSRVMETSPGAGWPNQAVPEHASPSQMAANSRRDDNAMRLSHSVTVLAPFAQSAAIGDAQAMSR